MIQLEKTQIETAALQETQNPTDDFGVKLDALVFDATGQNIDQPLIIDLNDHPKMGYDDFIRWLWHKIKQFAQWLWDLINGED